MLRLTREQLYKWVWSCPVTRIAEELGVSGSGLGRKCRVHNVPTPGRGYWHQLTQGRPVQCLLLPDPENGSDPVTIEVSIERAAELDLLPMPCAHSFTDTAASDDSSKEKAAFKEFERSEVSDTSVQSSADSGIFSPTESGEKNCEAIANPAAFLGLAKLYTQSEASMQFIEALKEAGRKCDAPTRAVLILWIGTARFFLSKSDPVAQVIEECRRIGSGAANPEWWNLLQQQ